MSQNPPTKVSDAEHAMAVFLQGLATATWKLLGPDTPAEDRTRENFRVAVRGYVEAALEHPSTPKQCHQAVEAILNGLDHTFLQLEGLESDDRLQ